MSRDRKLPNRRDAMKILGASVVGGATTLSAPANAENRGYDWEEVIEFTYQDADDFEHRWRSSSWNFRYYTGETAYVVEKVGYYHDEIQNEYCYVFDIESVHDAQDDDDGYVTELGVEIDVPDEWNVELKSLYDDHVRSGAIQDQDEKYPDDMVEEKMKQLGDLVLNVASINPAVNAANLLYSLIQLSDFSGEEHTWSIELETGSYPGERSVVFSHYDVIVRVPDYWGREYIDFEFFTTTRGGATHTITANPYLWEHD